MGLPEFTAELSLSKSSRVYRGSASYGNLTHAQSGIPANVVPSQFDDLQEPGNADETDFAAEEGSEDMGFEGSGEADTDDFENGEESELAGEDSATDEVGE